MIYYRNKIKLVIINFDIKIDFFGYKTSYLPYLKIFRFLSEKNFQKGRFFFIYYQIMEGVFCNNVS